MPTTKQASKGIVSYETDTGVQVQLSRDIVRKMICTDPNITDQEVIAFISLCQAQHLNPYPGTKDVYLIKYGNQPASIVVGKDVHIKRAAANDKFAGFDAGVVVINAEGELERRKGSLVLQDDELIGGWCDVYVKGYDTPISDTVSLAEYMGRKKDGSPNGQWAKMPATMIRKVAISHALREAFPRDLQGLYSADEMGDLEPIVATDYTVEDVHTQTHQQAPEIVVDEVLDGAEEF